MDYRLLLTPEETAQMLGIGRTRVFALIKTEKLASVTVGRSRRITPKAVEDYVRKLEEEQEFDHIP